MNIWGSPENRELVMSGLRRDGCLNQLPVTIRSRAGVQVDMVIDAKILMISGNRCLYLCAADVASQKRLEEQLRQSQKMEAIGQLTGGISHDFNNLLSVILGNCEIVKSNLAHDDESQKDLDAIIKSINRGSELTQRLLAFSRKQTLLPVSIALDEEIENTVSLLKRSLGESIEIHTETDDDLWA